MPATRILIANRGEIASRIQATAKRLGVETVAVYHGEDRNAPFVKAAEQAFELDATPPSAAYLDLEQILEIAQASHASAIHPGYGFLAENPQFARATSAQGLNFIGPSPEIIELMGDKLRSRDYAQEAGIPVAPAVAYRGDERAFMHAAESLGYPQIVKAAAGGGGKGMSLVRHRGELAEKLEASSREAKRYFADGRIYVEPYIKEARHIEVQVFGDGHGRAIHLGERECSIQRSYQKLIEESPASNLSSKLRETLVASALRLTEACKYEGAGTVEFILAPDGSYYFLEMNTRLQVEHPVTECVTGLDLVELQLRVALEKRLAITQGEVRFTGHAIEMRICAEDPDQDFLPCSGRLLRQVLPSGDGVRYDTGVSEGQTIGPWFDSMLAKLIVHAEDRAGAINKASRALEKLCLLGLTTNLDFLGRVLAHRAFVDGSISTSFLRQHGDDLKAPSPGEAQRDRVLIAALLGTRDGRRLSEMLTSIERHQ